MERDSISNREPGKFRGAFTLVEVIVALGICTVTVTALVGLLAPLTRSGAEAATLGRAVHLSEGIQEELKRLRDTTETDGTESRLEILAGRIPPSGSTDALRLVASVDGWRVIQESEAD